MTEEQRLAAGLKVGISNYVATAALAVLGGGLGLFTYVSQSFSPRWTFYALMALAAAMLVLSIVFGGDGTDQTVHEVAAGSWSNVSLWQFNAQAVLTLLALVALIAATAVGATSPKASDDADRRLEHVEQNAVRLGDRVQALQREQTRLRRELRRAGRR